MRKTAAILAVTYAAFASGQAAADTQRGRDGNLKIIFYQAVSVLNPFISSGNKDVDAAALVLPHRASLDVGSCRKLAEERVQALKIARATLHITHY